MFNTLSITIISICLIVSMLSSSIIVLWILMELSGFCLIYMLLTCDMNSNISFSSFLFYLINGISSILIVSGSFLESPLLIEFGLCSKFFLFPFSVLLFYIFNNVSWGVILAVGSMFKVFLLGLSGIVNIIINLELLIATIFICSFFILFVDLNIKGLWFILNLSSSIVLFVGCTVLNNSDVYLILSSYLVLSVINVMMLSSIEVINNTYTSLSNSVTLSYLLFLVGFPVSVNLVYKILSAILIINTNSSLLLVVWVSYIILETGLLYLYFSNILSNLKSLYYLVEFSSIYALQA